MVWLGKDISGKPVYTDLAKLPHLLIAGTTGSGKSGCVNCIISSMLLRATPDQVKMILIDPKKVELSHYDYIPHLLVPVVTNMKNAAGVLANVVKEMENRYELMELERSRQSRRDEPGSRLRRGERALPHVVVVVDELADLMMVSPTEVEEYIIRLAQKARAVGIHLVVATQRPSVDVITGMIKANIPSRIAFAVSSQTDSRVILDQNGAEALLGMGDMLFKPLGSTRLQRIQGAYITEEEIHLLVTHVRHQAQPEYREELLEAPAREAAGDEGQFDPDSDDLLEDAAELVLETGSASVSMLQRQAARGLHARRAADRHARAPGHRGPVRGQQVAADHGARRGAGARDGAAASARPRDAASRLGRAGGVVGDRFSDSHADPPVSVAVEVPRVSPAEAVDGNYVLVDVRSSARVRGGSRARGAVACRFWTTSNGPSVGLTYKERGAQQARLRGDGPGVARTCPATCAPWVCSRARGSRPAVMCWRGGERSRNVVLLLAAVGVHAVQVEGGYKAYRRWVLDGLASWQPDRPVVTLYGHTGAGKTAVLRALARLCGERCRRRGRGWSTWRVWPCIEVRFSAAFTNRGSGRRRTSTPSCGRRCGIRPATIWCSRGREAKIGRLFLPERVAALVREGTPVLVTASVEDRATADRGGVRPRAAGRHPTWPGSGGAWISSASACLPRSRPP